MYLTVCTCLYKSLSKRKEGGQIQVRVSGKQISTFVYTVPGSFPIRFSGNTGAAVVCTVPIMKLMPADDFSFFQIRSVAVSLHMDISKPD